MRLQLLSDVHVEFHADGGQGFVRSLDPAGIDVLVLAGDIAVGPGIVGALGLFCSRFATAKVLYVHGNHEFYGADREAVLGWTRQAAKAHENLVWLDVGVAEIDGRRFLGGPLWFRPGFEPKLRRAMADFEEIRGFESWVYEEKARMLAFLEAELREGDVVVTHHLPSQKSVAGRYSGSVLNSFFVCDVEDLIVERRPRLWLHGHTHASVDRRVGTTRVVCNPFGYAGWELNREFQDKLIVDFGKE